MISSPPSKFGRNGACGSSRHAFTRLDLVTLLSVLVVLGLMLIPALASGKTKAHSVVCQDNLKRLSLAWHLYLNDNGDKLVGVYQGSSAQGGFIANTPGKAPWALGWLDWTISHDNTNLLFITNDKYSKLAQYLNHSPEPFKCPSDTYVSKVQRALGWHERVRSVCAGGAMGEGDWEAGPTDPIYKHVRKVSDMQYPSPSETLLYLDEHPDSINDPAFQYPHQDSWISQPASYHDRAGSFSFADGHTEIHKWVASLAQLRAMKVKYNASVDAPAKAGDADIHWVSYHCSRKSETSY